MQKTVFISLPIEELQAVITDCINACIKSDTSSRQLNEQPLNLKELCVFLGITEPTVLRWRKKGIIPYLKLGSRILYQKTEVIKALENKKRG